MAKTNKFLTGIVFIIRVLVGLVFIFSAFVKGVDPLGTAYRVEDYLEAYGWYFMVDYSLMLGNFLIIIEFLLGVSMLFRLKFKLGTLGVLLIMMIFTVVTYFDAKLNLVPDCGCFGDAIKLTNWETFYKNIVLIILAFILFLLQKHVKQSTPQWFQWILILFFTLGFSYFVYYNLNHLPVVDFRNWKEGKNMKTIGEDKAKVYVSYKNKETGEIKEYLSPNYPWSDSTWLQNWEFLGQRFDNSSVEKMHELIIQDSIGNDYTKDLIENPGTQVLLITPDLFKVNLKGLEKGVQLRNNIDGDAYFAVITGSDYQTAGRILGTYDDLEVYFADDILLKAMIRSNPGIVIIKNGIVFKKIHYNDFPEKLELN